MRLWNLHDTVILKNLVVVVSIHIGCILTFVYTLPHIILGKKQVKHKDNLSAISQYLNPLTPKSDWRQISPYNITSESNIKVTRITQMVAN